MGEAQVRALLAITGCAALGMIAFGAIYILLPVLDLVYQPVPTLVSRGPIAAVASGIGWLTLAVVCAAFLILEKMGHIGVRLDHISSNTDAIVRKALAVKPVLAENVWPSWPDRPQAMAADAVEDVQERLNSGDSTPTIQSRHG